MGIAHINFLPSIILSAGIMPHGFYWHDSLIVSIAEGSCHKTILMIQNGPTWLQMIKMRINQFSDQNRSPLLTRLHAIYVHFKADVYCPLYWNRHFICHIDNIRSINSWDIAVAKWRYLLFHNGCRHISWCQRRLHANSQSYNLFGEC